jgi:hypothetical protein
MKLTSRFVVFQRTLFVAAVLLGSAELCAGRSVLDQERSEFDFARAEFFGSNDLFKGALTLENLYSFDYASAGIGTVIFRSNSKQFQSYIIDHDSPRAVGSWASPSESDPFISPSFAALSPSFERGRSISAFDDSTDPTSPGILAPVPEPSTWIGGALLLAFVVFTQRRRFTSRSRASA